MESLKADMMLGSTGERHDSLEKRLEALYEISEMLSRSVAREEVTAVVTGQVLHVFGAAGGGLLELTPDGKEVILVGSFGFPDRVTQAFQRFPLETPVPVRDAIQNKIPIFLRDGDAWRAHYPATPVTSEGARVVLPLIVDQGVVGAITLTFADAREFAEDEIDFMMSIAHHCALALARARLFDEHAQHVEALAKLHAISVSLSGALTKHQVAAFISDHLTGTLGAVMTGVLELTEDGREFLLLHSKNWTSDHQQHLQRFPVDTPLPVRDAVLNGEPIFLRDAQEWLDRGYSHPPGSGFVASIEGARVALPLRIGDRVIGVLSLTYSNSHKFTGADREFLLAVASQCAQALDRARLYDAEHTARLAAEQAALRTYQLQRSASALAATITRHDVAQCVVEQVRAALHPAAAAVLELSEDQTELRLLVADGTSDAARDRYSTIPVDARVPATDAIRSGEPIFLRSRDEWDARYASDAAVDPARRAWATVPMVVEQRPVGVLTLTFNEERAFPSEERAFLTAFANQCAVAIERARLYEEAETARGRAEQANAAKSQFLGIMSHELRTPLNAVIGYADLLLMEVRGTLSAEQKIQVERIRSSAWHQLSLIEEILSYARIEAGKEEVRVSRIDVKAIIADTVELLRPDAHRKKLALQVSLEPADLIADTDPAKVRQVILNLAGNAVKFTMQGTVEIGARRSADSIVCYVRDTGPGIPADKLDVIWQPFTQVDQSDTRREGGTGLGLTIARRLAALLGGSVTVDSTLGKGTTFEFRLPSVPG